MDGVLLAEEGTDWAVIEISLAPPLFAEHEAINNPRGKSVERALTVELVVNRVKNNWNSLILFSDKSYHISTTPKTKSPSDWRDEMRNHEIWSRRTP